MKMNIKWKDRASFLGEAESGHSVLMGGAPEVGGRNLGLRPMEMVLMGAGGCIALDVVLILKKGRQEISDCMVEIEAERARKDPRVFTHIHYHFILTGNNIKPHQVERAISLSAEKYCSASIMLGKTAKMSHDYEIVKG
jgi:putative redox protein